MNTINKILQQIEKLPEAEKTQLLQQLNKLYPQIPEDAHVVGSNYDFWLNDDDDVYDKL